MVEELLGVNVHPEVLRRAAPVLGLLAANDALSAAQVGGLLS